MEEELHFPDKRNLCETCWNMPDCILIGIREREKCDEYDPMPMDELLERDAFVGAIMEGACPKCGSENTCDCEDYPLAPEQDNTVGYCTDCGTYWCLECGYIFKEAKKGMQCPHWAICEECAEEHGYLCDFEEFMEKVCPTCEHHGESGCEIEWDSPCPRELEFHCPYGSSYGTYHLPIRECPKIKDLLTKEQD